MISQDDNPGRQCWVTPPAFMEWVTEKVLPVFMRTHFVLDVCATAENRRAEWFIGPLGSPDHPRMVARDGLAEKTDWSYPAAGSGAAWCNPGYTKIQAWAEKAVAESMRGTFVCLLSQWGHSTGWYRFLMEHATAKVEVNPRIQFLPAPGVKKSSNPLDNYLWVLDPGQLGRGAETIYPDPWRPSR